jgi:sterol desaturase/sphingolipid hydroxylase (fatty acid hydroxylase superfamily)
MEVLFANVIDVFVDAQKSQSAKWFLNYQMYLAVACLAILSLIFPARKWTRQDMVGWVQDYFYGIAHTLVVFPAVAVYVSMLHYVTDRWMPWIRIDVFGHLPGYAHVLIAILLDDCLGFISHFIRHKVRPLWHFHTLHHSQEYLNAFTTKRFHIVEKLFTEVIIKWIPLAIMGSPVEVWLAFYLIDAIWDYLIHSNIRMSLGPLKYLLVSPQYHRIHHSRLPEHYDKNFSDRFVIWDLIFGTAYLKSDEYPPTGVPGVPFPHEKSGLPWKIAVTYIKQWCYPFRMIYRDITSGGRQV